MGNYISTIAVTVWPAVSESHVFKSRLPTYKKTSKPTTIKKLQTKLNHKPKHKWFILFHRLKTSKVQGPMVLQHRAIGPVPHVAVLTLTANKHSKLRAQSYWVWCSPWLKQKINQISFPQKNQNKKPKNTTHPIIHRTSNANRLIYGYMILTTVGSSIQTEKL